MTSQPIYRRPRPVLHLLAIAVLALVSLTACGGTEPARSAEGAATTAGDKLKVVATFSVIGDLVRNVAEDRVELTTLVPAGADAHTFEPSPGDSMALVDATLIFENGIEFEGWLPELVEASGSQAQRVVVSEGIEVIEAGDDHADGGDHREGEQDPHVWHDAHNAIKIVENIRDALVEADPEGATAYRARADMYIARLEELDAFMLEQAMSLPEERRKLVTTHDTFGYFAQRYDFDIVDTALGISTEENEPAAAQIAALVEEIRAAKTPAIFAENISSSALIEQIAREAGVKVAPPVYSDALGEPGSEGETYIDMMRYNISTIVTALAP